MTVLDIISLAAANPVLFPCFPFYAITGERPEICAMGFRNPFRCAFDKKTDELYCGDVGQDMIEEVNHVR